MIFAHAVVGIMPVDNSHFSWFWLLGSLAPDLDHLAVLLIKRIPLKKIADSMKFEEKYGLRYKTKYLHSIFGALVMTAPVAAISRPGALLFFAAYLIHLLWDWLDLDEKEYFYPFKIKIRGFLPIFSRPEKIFTLLLMAAAVWLYL